jgi:hypothetical protein
MWMQSQGTTVREYLGDLLTWAHARIELEQPDPSSSQHQGYCSAPARICWNCARATDRCWLNGRDTRIFFSERPVPELIKALGFSLYYLDSHGSPHNRHCSCDRCLWVTEARQFHRTARKHVGQFPSTVRPNRNAWPTGRQLVSRFWRTTAEAFSGNSIKQHSHALMRTLSSVASAAKFAFSRNI